MVMVFSIERERKRIYESNVAVLSRTDPASNVCGITPVNLAPQIRPAPKWLYIVSLAIFVIPPPSSPEFPFLFSLSLNPHRVTLDTRRMRPRQMEAVQVANHKVQYFS